MDPIMLIKNAGPSGWGIVGLSLLSTLVVLACGVGWALRRPVPPVVALLPLLAATLTSTRAGSLGAAQSLEAVAHASAEMKQTLLAAGVYVGLANTLIASWALILPLMLVFLVSGATGTRGDVRRTRPPAAAAALGGLTFVLLAISAVQTGTGWGALALTLLAVPLVAVGLSSDGDDSAAPVAGATGALAFPLFVGLMVAGNTAAGLLEAFNATARASAEMKSTLLGSGIAVSTSGLTVGLMAVLSASGVALVGASSAASEEAPGRAAGAFAGLATVVVALALLLGNATAVLELMRLELR